ncbi:hypothetical protein AFM11_22190 [Mycolicibacterium wolinskyi]|uniref:PASTA domain-containing protein n=1 Tax=Mycolicibacterium wolinskyi TaxID=59750 RepID=A0A132PIW4_9MYCO|nr:hypothetical protein [Mycolicibacterium wolinskyi]KWX22204.1 hypothetical protein AFM11_22190 [Mycolicibacterium wolinskyi]
MKSLTVAAVSGAMAAVGVGLAGVAGAAPTAPTSPTQAVNDLRAQGYNVIVNKVGAAPLEQCVVDGIRPGQTFTRMDSGVAGAGDDIRTTVTAQTVYVDVSC